VRIGLLTTSFPRTTGDYAGSFVGDRVRDLLDQGHTVEVLAAGDEVERDHHPRLTVTRLPSALPGQPALFYGAGAPEVLERGGLAAALAALRFSAALAAAAAARAASWDLVEAHWLVPSALVGLAAAPRLRCRAYAHSGDVALLERIAGGRALARQLVRGGTELRFVTEDLQARFGALVGRTVGVVERLPAPAALFGPGWAGPDQALRRSFGLASPTVIAVGRLVPIKGHALLLRSCARARAGGANAELVILGDGPERPRLARLSRELGVPLRLPGFVPRPEVARWLRAADVYVQPSIPLPNGRTEGAPLATAEARAVGIPVVVESDAARLARAIASAIGGLPGSEAGSPSVTSV
jgi:glycosyltransferase involved in cell wall biosynthesis